MASHSTLLVQSLQCLQVRHSCPLCREEAIVERCPNYDPDKEGSWGEEDSDAPTNPEIGEWGLGAWMSPEQAVNYLRWMAHLELNQ